MSNRDAQKQKYLTLGSEGVYDYMIRSRETHVRSKAMIFIIYWFHLHSLPSPCLMPFSTSSLCLGHFYPFLCFRHVFVSFPFFRFLCHVLQLISYFLLFQCHIFLLFFMAILFFLSCFCLISIFFHFYVIIFFLCLSIYLVVFCFFFLF